ncbi:MAG: hypothetical protein QF463_11125 [Vicinamibacterales bacterium]|nr:hypothetical protein [Acidobacteriota bacterium]MDP6371559.1 hypothetical protein [Vicinamibacterales bacterium]MDP6609607.1 hypothetical protein [Vicinamibacterales bacterium]HAK55136.1 hypothetical protein [Acidobacteriota bacterium]
MSLKDRLRVAMICGVLQLGVLTGVPMRPEQIQALMDLLNQPKLAHTLPAENEDGDEPREP